MQQGFGFRVSGFGFGAWDSGDSRCVVCDMGAVVSIPGFQSKIERTYAS